MIDKNQYIKQAIKDVVVIPAEGSSGDGVKHMAEVKIADLFQPSQSFDKNLKL